MALPVGVTKLGSFKGNKGDKGNTGSLAFATAESVPADQPAGVEMIGPESLRGAHFKVPRGLPGVNAVENDAAVSAYLAAIDSDSRAALDAVLLQQTVPLSIMKPVPSMPAGFRGLSVLPTPTIRRSVGRFTVDENVFESLKPSGGGVFYTAPGALTTADGLTPATPKRMASLLIDAPSGSTIVLADGEYTRIDANTVTGGVAKSLRMIPGGDFRPVVSGVEPPSLLTWTNTTGAIYQTTRSATIGVLDVVNRTVGVRTPYEKKPDLASITGPGQWAIVGTTVYVWAIGGTNLASDSSQIRLHVLSSNGAVATGAGNTIWVEGIDFIACGGTDATYPGGLVALNGAIVVNKDCKVMHNVASDGVMTRDGGHMISIRCEVAFNARDGFNYHNTLAGGLGDFIEIDCTSHDNGVTPGAGTNNASTAHEATTGIRVGGLYGRASGPVIADVNSAQSWNLGVHAGGSAQAVSSSQDQSWRTDGAAQIEGEGVAKIWLDECTSDGALYAVGTTNGSEIEIHAFGYSNPNGAYAGSLVANYTR